MSIPAEKWYESIKNRHSTRKFDGYPVNNELLVHLDSIIENLNTKINGARIALVAKKPDKVFKGIIGSYGKIKNAPMYAAFIGDLSDPHVQEKTGYLGEFFILEATAAGLSSCWIGGTFSPEAVKGHIDIGETEKVLAVSPLGYGIEDGNLEEKLMKGLVGSHKRKAIDRLCVGVQESKWSENKGSEGIKLALEAARLAPSAMNRQPWRFTVESDSIKVSVDSENFSMGVSKRLDCGIAMAHIEVGALYCGLQGTWQYLKAPDVARFKMK